MTAPGTNSELDQLVERALDLLETQGEAALDELYRQNPSRADSLRARIDALRHVGLLQATGPSAPERLGGFRLLRPLGEGGMGIVYLALQEDLGREVALKVIRPEHMFFPGARKRFRREVEIIARLAHPGIVPIHTVGEENGIPYFAMELLRGETLEQSLARLRGREPATLSGRDLAPAPDAESYLFEGTWEHACLRVVRQVAEALEHAHQRGVLHRDIKPSNVLVTTDGQSRAVLLDFGLASSGRSGKLTRSGEQLGSLNYMAPEQVRGSGELDRRSDVYSLGVTLYELLSLRVAFDGRADTEILRAIERGSPRSLRELNPRVSWEAQTVCAAAMELDPARRYASAADFARDLENVLGKRPIEARRAGAWRRAQRWVERNPARAAALVLGGVLLVGVPTMYAWQQRRSALAIGVQRDRAERNLGRALAAVDRMLTRVGEEHLRTVPQMEPVRRALLEDAVALLDEFVAEETGNVRAAREVARARVRLGRLLRDLGRSSEAIATLRAGLSALEQSLAHDANDAALAAELIEARLALAHALANAGSVDDALALHALVESELTRLCALHPDDARLARLALTNQVDRSVSLVAAARTAQARAELDRASVEAESLVDRFPEDGGALALAARAWNELGNLAMAGNTVEEEPVPDAERAFERVIELCQQQRLDRPEEPGPRYELALAHNNLGGALRRAKQFELAASEYEAAQAELEELVARFPSTLVYKFQLSTIANQIGLLADVQGDAARAATAYRRALDLARQLTEHTPSDAAYWNRRARTQANLAGCIGPRGNDVEAERLLVECLELDQRALALAPDNVQFGRDLLGHVSMLHVLRRERGDFEAAARTAEQASVLLPDDWKSWSGAAVNLARLVERVRNSPELTDDERARLERGIAERAVAMIKGAIEHGVPGSKDLHQLRDLAPLFGMEAFESYAAELAQREP